MAFNTPAPKQTNWWVWAGAAVVTVALIAALGYGLDWFGSGAAVGPMLDQSPVATD